MRFGRFATATGCDLTSDYHRVTKPLPDSSQPAGADGRPRAGPELAAALIDALELPVVSSDAGGRLVLANAAARELWGLPERLDDGTAVEWFEPDPQRPAELDPLARALAGERPIREWRYAVTATGSSVRCWSARSL